MESCYFKEKIKTNKFKANIKTILDNIKNKKVIIYGVGKVYNALNNLYDLNNNVNIIAIADIKFEKSERNNSLNLKCISPKDIKNEDFDTILITNEYYEPIVKYLQNELYIENSNLIPLLKQDKNEERDTINYLCKYNFQKKLSKLIKKLKNKKIVLYGAGKFFEVINDYYDLSSLNITAISDRKFKYAYNGECFGYKICPPQDIKYIKPDYVLITTKYFVNIYEYLQNELLKNTGIKILPLFDKPFFVLLNEMWNC